MNSKTAKKLIKGRCRMLGNDYAGAVEEVTNTWNADLIAVKWGGEVVEYEIKCSKADLVGEIRAIRAAIDEANTMEMVPQYRLPFARADDDPIPLVAKIKADIKLSHTKIAKHRHYLVKQEEPNRWGTNRRQFRPHKFYFAVPTELVDVAKAELKGIKQYGVYNVETGEIVKKAFRIHTDSIGDNVFFDLFTRACTERAEVERELKAASYWKTVYDEGEQIPVWTGEGYRKHNLNRKWGRQ